MKKISEWLASNGLEKYVAVFASQLIGADILLQLTEADLEKQARVRLNEEKPNEPPTPDMYVLPEAANMSILVRIIPTKGTPYGYCRKD